MDFDILTAGTVKKILAFFVVLFLSGCMGVWITRIPEMESDGAQVYIVRCGVCHALPHPKRHTYQQWIHIIGLMNEMMEKRSITALSKVDENIILSYLNKNAR